MFAERDKHYPSRSGQTSLATAIANITKPVTKNNFGPSSCVPQYLSFQVESRTDGKNIPLPLLSI